MSDWVGEAHDAEMAALYGIFEYRPRSIAENNRRCDYLLKQKGWFESIMSEDVKALLASGATLPAGVA